mmetsp:Transcript_8222/g.9014  ORF Transcript_8222/g.9014 Transcript_8222/m.9014 type:complete len:85 (+) Transcript_8222:489-743(+)
MVHDCAHSGMDVNHLPLSRPPPPNCWKRLMILLLILSQNVLCYLYTMSLSKCNYTRNIEDDWEYMPRFQALSKVRENLIHLLMI